MVWKNAKIAVETGIPQLISDCTQQDLATYSYLLQFLKTLHRSMGLNLESE